MLVGNLGTAALEASESRLHNQLSGIVSRGSLEGASRAGVFQRLLLTALCRQLLHSFPDLPSVSLFQPENDLRYRKRIISDRAGTIAKLHGFVVQLHDPAFAVHDIDLCNNLAQLSSVGSGIHYHAAAYCSRNTGRKFHSRQLMLHCRPCDLRHGCPCLCDNDITLDCHSVHFRADLQNHTAKARVTDKQITAVSQDEKGYAHLAQIFLNLYQLFCIFQLHKAIGKPTDTKGGVACH